MHNAISFVRCGESLPMETYSHSAHPSGTATEILSKILGYQTNENDVRQSSVEFYNDTLYLIYTAVVPIVQLSSGFQWHSIEEIFNEKTDKFISNMVSKSISYT